MKIKSVLEIKVNEYFVNDLNTKGPSILLLVRGGSALKATIELGDVGISQ